MGYLPNLQKGMTLFEVLVVMVIMGLLMGIAMLSFHNMQQRYNVEQQVKQLYSDVMNSRVRAVQRDRMQFVTFSGPTNTSYSVYEDGPPPDGNGLFSAATDSLVGTYNLLPTYSAVLSNPSMTLLQFSAQGLLVSPPPGTITITPSAGGEYDCIFVDQIKTGMGQWNGTQCIVK